MSRYMSGCFLFLIVPFLAVVEGMDHIFVVKPGDVSQIISNPHRVTVTRQMTTVAHLKAAVNRVLGWGDHKIGLWTKSKVLLDDTTKFHKVIR
ncbi:hypothetical protein Ddc_21089 [Ditylenchus destructor]|nr:hypothetical protein Ddc_21089 [Ditylenchus destructor]